MNDKIVNNNHEVKMIDRCILNITGIKKIINFDNKEFNNGFEYEFNPNFHSGYYHKPQTLKFDCSDTIWYTTDGTLPEKNKTAYEPCICRLLCNTRLDGRCILRLRIQFARQIRPIYLQKSLQGYE